MKTRLSLGRVPALFTAILAVGGILCSDARAGTDNPVTRHEGVGIWKAYVPHGVKGEFDSYDPVGLMAGALIKADCSLNWRDPDTGKLYCFASGTSQVYFQDWPKTNVRKARAGYDRLLGQKPGS